MAKGFALIAIHGFRTVRTGPGTGYSTLVQRGGGRARQPTNVAGRLGEATRAFHNRNEFVVRYSVGLMRPGLHILQRFAVERFSFRTLKLLDVFLRQLWPVHL